MDLTVLGSGGWISTPSRQTAAFLVRQSNVAIVLDAGTGLQRLRLDPELSAGIRRLDIVLSHFHLDHVVGLSYVSGVDIEEIAVWGPGAVLGRSTADVLQAMLSPPYFSSPMSGWISEVNEIREGENDVGGLIVRARVQPNHPGGSCAYRIEDELCYCTDTAYDDANREFAEDVRLLLHEAWDVDVPSKPQSHSSAVEAARIAAGANAGALGLCHLPPSHLHSEMLAAAQTVFPNAFLTADGQSFSV